MQKAESENLGSKLYKSNQSRELFSEFKCLNGQILSMNLKGINGREQVCLLGHPNLICCLAAISDVLPQGCCMGMLSQVAGLLREQGFISYP